MDFSIAGGKFTVQFEHPHGLWEVSVPWEVAIDGWKAETNRDVRDKGELMGWLNDNLQRFADMVAARVGAIDAQRTPDDPRVTAVKLMSAGCEPPFRAPQDI